MREKRIKVAVFCLAFFALGNQVKARQQEDDEGAQLEAVTNIVRESLIEAQTNNIPGFPRLKDVTITLQTMVNKGAGIQVNFLIFTIGTKYESETASTLKLTMKPPATTDVKNKLAAVDPEKVRLALAQAINLAKEGVINANRADPPLMTSNIEIELKFAVKVEGSGSAKVTQLLPLGIDGTAKLARQKVHAIKLTFGK